MPADPRARITYEVTTREGPRDRELPFVIGVLAGLSGQPEQRPARLMDRSFTDLDRGVFDEVLRAAAPRLAFEVEDKLAGDNARLWVELGFERLADFGPEAVAAQVPGLPELLAADDARASAQLDEILHAPEFQRLEATWRGLAFLVAQTETSQSLKIRVLNVSRRELLHDLATAVRFDQSIVFKKVHDDVYGSDNPEPFGVLIGDYEFGYDAEDLELLERMSAVAEAAQAPFLAAAAPHMFGWEDFTEMAGVDCDELKQIPEGESHSRWRSFRRSAYARYVCLALPRMLLRLPYCSQTIRYRENVDEQGSSGWLWGNPAYALATRLADSFRVSGWWAGIRGADPGRRVEGLPARTLARLPDTIRRYLPNWWSDTQGEGVLRSTTELPVLDRQQHQLSRHGFACLCSLAHTDAAAFFTTPSCFQPDRPAESLATAAPWFWANLPYVMAAARFAQYLKAILCDRRNSFRSREDCERVLNEWIANYVTRDDDAPREVKARYPLRDARIEVCEDPGNPGAWQAVVYLRPHFDLDDPGLPQPLAIPIPFSFRAGL